MPDSITEGSQGIKAVLVDEEAVGSVGTPGCGAKILKGDDVTQQFLHETESKVSFSATATFAKLTDIHILLRKLYCVS